MMIRSVSYRGKGVTNTGTIPYRIKNLPCQDGRGREAAAKHSTRKSYIYKRDAGFTLIELLTVVVIVSLLSAIIFTNLATGKAKARDARRIADLEQLQLALELYRGDNEMYPTGSYTSTDDANWANLATVLAEYMRILPRDPVNLGVPSSGGYAYHYCASDESSYDLLARFETSHRLSCENQSWTNDNCAPLQQGSGLPEPWCDIESRLYDANR